jgi:hypothetical protein
VSADAPILYDWSGAPVAAAYAPITARPGTALPSPAGGMVALGSDYGSTPKAQIPHVDTTGSLYVVPTNPVGAASQVYSGQAPGALTTQYGTLGMMRGDSPNPSQYLPFLADPNGNLATTVRPYSTFRSIIRQVATGANKYLAVVTNASASAVVLRVTEVTIYVPPSGASGALLSSTNVTYYPLICEIYRVPVASVTAGTTISPISCDTADLLSPAVVVSSSPTISSYTSSLYRADAYAYIMTGENFYQQDNLNDKALVIRPGEGIAIICISSGTLNNSIGGQNPTTNTPADIQILMTQASA